MKWIIGLALRPSIKIHLTLPFHFSIDLWRDRGGRIIGVVPEVVFAVVERIADRRINCVVSSSEVGVVNVTPNAESSDIA